MSSRYYSLPVLARFLGTQEYVKGNIAKKLRADAKSQMLPAKKVSVVSGRYRFTYAADVGAITRYLRLPKDAEWFVEKALILALEELKVSHPRTFLTQERIDKELSK